MASTVPLVLIYNSSRHTSYTVALSPPSPLLSQAWKTAWACRHTCTTQIHINPRTYAHKYCVCDRTQQSVRVLAALASWQLSYGCEWHRVAKLINLMIRLQPAAAASGTARFIDLHENLRTGWLIKTLVAGKHGEERRALSSLKHLKKWRAA